jgi:polar amino acid transport system substrate-binding protein
MDIFRIAAVILFASIAGCATTDGPLDAVRSELAPTGKLRLTVPSNANYVNPPMTPPYSGIAVDIGNAMAKGLGVPLEVRLLETIPAILDEVKAGKCDMILVGIEDSRRAIVDYTSAYAVTQNSYLVPAGSALMTIRDVDRGGVRVAASKGTIQHRHLETTLKNASIVSTTTVGAATADLAQGKADAVAANRTMVEEFAARMPGYRVLPGSFMEIAYGAGVAKGRSAGQAYADKVIREMRANGEIARSIARHNLKALTLPVP